MPLIGLCISERIRNREELPSATAPFNLTLESGDSSVLIEFDYQAYLKRHNGKAVKKTLTIPEWLNEAAMAKGINFSQVLQEALMNAINA